MNVPSVDDIREAFERDAALREENGRLRAELAEMTLARDEAQTDTFNEFNRRCKAEAEGRLDHYKELAEERLENVKWLHKRVQQLECLVPRPLPEGVCPACRVYEGHSEGCPA